MKTPETRLMSAVIHLAVLDVCLPPIRIEVEKQKKKVLVMSYFAQNAYEFLFADHGDGYYMALDMDPTETKKRLVSLLLDLSHNRPFDVTSKNLELISRKKRMFRINSKLYYTKQLRGNFKEVHNRKLTELEEELESEED